MVTISCSDPDDPMGAPAFEITRPSVDEAKAAAQQQILNSAPYSTFTDRGNTIEVYEPGHRQPVATITVDQA